MKIIKEFPMYLINKEGSIYSKYKNKYMTPVITPEGYYKVALIEKGKRKNCWLHRLIGESFIPNPHNKTTINHKNGIKTDNRLSNLEWATQGENNVHAIVTELNKKAKKVKQISKETGAVLNIFRSGCMAAKKTKQSTSANIHSVLKGNRRSAGGFRWEYA